MASLKQRVARELWDDDYRGIYRCNFNYDGTTFGATVMTVENAIESLGARMPAYSKLVEIAQSDEVQKIIKNY